MGVTSDYKVTGSLNDFARLKIRMFLNLLIRELFRLFFNQYLGLSSRSASVSKNILINWKVNNEHIAIVFHDTTYEYPRII